MHRLLKRQLKKANLSTQQIEELSVFLDSVDAAYNGYENDLAQVENILEKSSSELYRLNQILKKDIEAKENLLDEVINSVPEIIFMLDQEGKWLFVNDAWTKTTGIAKKDTIGRSFMEFIEMIKNPDLDHLQSLPHNWPQDYQRDFSANFSDDKMAHFSIRFKKHFDENGKEDGIIGIILNLTDIRENEEKLKKARQAAEKAGYAKDEFLSTMSHEIRTPLNAVIGMSNLLLLDDPKEHQLENLGALKYSGEHLLQLINDILDFNKIEAGKIEFTEEDFSLKAMLDGIYANFSYLSKEKGIKFKIKKNTSIPDVLKGDVLRLTQVLTNLIGNAIKFTENGGVVLDIDLIKEKEDQLVLKFDVQDSGIGIKEENIDKIFKTFTQAEESTTRKFGGTGLGLAISKKLLNLQESALEVKSTFGVGSSFYFSLPFKISNQFNFSPQVTTLSNPSFGNLDGINVLVAEDNRLNVLVLKQFFAKWNVQYDLAVNGQEAVDKYRNNDYDLVLMDLQMPIMNGFDAAINILATDKAKNSNTPIIAISASVNDDVKVKAKASGMIDYIGKPFNPNELYQKLKYWVSLQK